MGAVNFSIDADLVAALQRALPLEQFVETGTFEGDSVRAVRDGFDHIHTIESADELYEQAETSFADDAGVTVHHGHSPDVLARLVPDLRKRSVLYWLDAHWCGDSPIEDHPRSSPLVAELRAIGRLNARSALLIDDARLYLAPPPAKTAEEDWPDLDSVLAGVRELGRQHTLLIINDMIVLYPKRAAEEVRGYADEHGVDWLTAYRGEQRAEHLAGMASNLRDRLQRLERREGRRSARDLEPITTALQELSERVSAEPATPLVPDALSASIDELGAKLLATEGLARTAAEHGAALTAEMERLAALAGEVDRIRATVEKLEGLQPQAEIMERNLATRMDTHMEVVHGQIDGELGAIDELGTSVTAARKDLASLGEWTRTAQPKLDGLGALDERLEQLTGESERTSTELQRLHMQNESTHASLAQLLSLVPAVEEARAASMATRREVSAGREGKEIAALRREIATLRRGMAPIRAEHAERRQRRHRRMLPFRRLAHGMRRARNMTLNRARQIRDRIVGQRLGRLEDHAPRDLRIPRRYERLASPAEPPSIAIVTPSYNQGRFLRTTIASVLSQDYPALSYVVQDGGSSDDSELVLKGWNDLLTDTEIRPDRGQAHAINLGFEKVSAEIMAYLNADDLLLPGALNYVGRFFARHQDVDVVYGHRVLIDGDDREIGRWVMPRHDDQILAWADYVPQETLFWRREIWERAGGEMDEEAQFALDWDLLLRFEEAGAKFRRLPRFLGAFRVHEDQKTTANAETTGSDEMAKIRRRVHGRDVSREEIASAIKPYLRRHAVLNRLYRARLLRY